MSVTQSSKEWGKQEIHQRVNARNHANLNIAGTELFGENRQYGNDQSKPQKVQKYGKKYDEQRGFFHNKTAVDGKRIVFI
ncbi:hypothetical protein LBMAG25_05060 [Bacteroidota bacterium]|nr:hypothetical protein LBMAG25_05060 [Bacteroidota bacterium]